MPDKLAAPRSYCATACFSGNLRPRSSVPGSRASCASRATTYKDAAEVCAAGGDVAGDIVTLQTTLAGVPAVLRVPKVITKAPIVPWHGFGPPASETALMKALPLDEVAAVKVYLGLPLFGLRAPLVVGDTGTAAGGGLRLVDLRTRRHGCGEGASFGAGGPT